MQVIFHSDTSQVYEVTRRLLYVRIGPSVSRRLGECKISRQEKSAMLTETAVQNGFSEHLFGRAMREKRSAGAPAPGGSVERMGTPMSFGRDVEIYGGRGARRLSLQDHLRGSSTYKVLIDGRRQIGAIYLPGDIFGLETGEEHAFSAEAVVDSKVLVIKRSTVVSLATWDSDVARQLWTLTGRELQRTQNHVLLLIKTAPRRVASFLLEMAERIQDSDEVELPMWRRDKT
jgi:CRP/FNR family transcriptional regulator, nitrogen fixation regulation protein